MRRAGSPEMARAPFMTALLGVPAHPADRAAYDEALLGERGGHAGIQLSVAALMPKLRRAPAPTPDPPHVSPPSCEIRREVNGEAILLARIVMHPLHKSRAPLTLLLSCLKPSKVDLLDIGR